MKPAALLAVALSLPFIASCDSTTTPTPPPVALTISCPQPVVATSLTGNPVTVNYTAAVAAGGKAPVTVSCSPASGQPFPLGATAVSCLAKDAQPQAAACAFTVTVSKVAQLSVTKFLAFGDSITAGVLAGSCPIGGGVSCSVATPTSAPRSTASLIPFGSDLRTLYPFVGEESSSAYPRQLQAALTANYNGQTFTMTNLGSPGEFIAEGKARLSSALIAAAPGAAQREVAFGRQQLQEHQQRLEAARPGAAQRLRELAAEVRARTP